MVSAARTRSFSGRLLAHLDEARRLAADGAFLGSFTGFEAWRERQQDWRDATAHTFDGRFEQEALAEFLYATLQPDAPPENWRHTLAEDLRRIAGAIELLAGLRSTLAEPEPEPRSRTPVT